MPTNNSQQKKGRLTMKIMYELTPTNRRKSFYGKAKVVEMENGDIGLLSYSTIVARIHNGKFERLWSGYSATTMNHINSFLDTLGIDGGGKSWWIALDVVEV